MSDGMSDELADRFRRLDQPRDLPPELRDRLQRALLADDALGADLALADRSRPLPVGTRAGLEAALLSGMAAEDMPSSVRRRLERRLTAQRWSREQALLAVAAVVLLVAGTTLAVTSGRGSHRSGGGTIAAGPRATKSTSELDPGAASGATATSAGLSAAADRGATGGAAAGGSAQSFAGFSHANGPAPPFAFGASSTSDSAPAAAGSTKSASPAKSTLRVAVISGDANAEKGFRAYVDLVNGDGGAGGHHIDVVTTKAGAPVKNVVATVNLSSDPVATSGGAPSWITTPLLETLSAPESVLHGDVFSMASVLERQAHLAVDGAFPNPAPGKRAVIYIPAQGVFADRVAPAFEEALRSKQVASVRQVADPSTQPLFVDADAAFVSLSASDTGQWVRRAHDAHYAPGQVWGLATMFDESLASVLPPRTTVASPYRLLVGGEADALRRGTGQAALDARVVHGWVTAKWLAVAIWSRDADTATRVSAALAASNGYDSGWAPPYAVRAGTRSRTPEAVDLTPSGATFTSGGFRQDRL